MTSRRRVRAVARTVVANLIVAIGIVLVFTDFGGARTFSHWREFLRAAATGFVFAMCIAPTISWAMPYLVPAIWQRLRFPLNWVAIAGMMAGFALAGSAVAIGMLILVRYVPAGEFWRWYFGSMRISIAVTLTVGLFVTAYEMNKSRLAQANTQAQLASLESRVQPHFLFNTLNSIAALAHDDPTGAERMTTQLASLLRSSLDTRDTPLVPIGDELALVRSYLDIERVRFGDRLRFSIDTDGLAPDTRVPRMAIQTLVENSVKYAVSPRREGATIDVRAGVAGGRVQIAVSDDGPGFDAAELPEGHGLALLRARLDVLFGRGASLRVTSAAAGTSVTIDLPTRHGRAAVPQCD